MDVINILTLWVRGPTLDVKIWSLLTSDSDVWSRSPHWKHYKFIMAVDPKLRYSNEAEKANWDIDDDFYNKNLYGLHGLYKNIPAL